MTALQRGHVARHKLVTSQATEVTSQVRGLRCIFMVTSQRGHVTHAHLVTLYKMVTSHNVPQSRDRPEP
eukprot:1780622-Rhodomonas_salina.1